MFEFLKLVHLLAFASLVGTLVSELVISCALHEKLGKSLTTVIKTLETIVMPASGALLLLSGIGLWAVSGFVFERWIISLVVLWLVGFVIAHVVGGPALRAAAWGRWRASAIFSALVLITATWVAILKP